MQGSIQTRDIEAVSRLSTSLDTVDRLIADSLDALGGIIDFDLATVMELRGQELSVRVARGRLADERVARHKLALDAFPAIQSVLQGGTARVFDDHDHSGEDGDPFDGVLDLEHGHFCMVAPLRAHDGALGLLTVDRAVCGTYPDEAVRLANVFARLLAEVIRYGEQSVRLDGLRRQLEERVRLLRDSSGPADPRALMEASVSAPMQHVVRMASQVAATDSPVLVTGETGTGKGVLASAIHAWSERARGPFVSLNCAALPETLIESELFGHVRGAFSGATSDRLGRFKAADGGTLFLDEVGEIPPALQAKLLRAVQDGCFEPVGSDRTVRVDVRIVAATNIDLQRAIADGSFREDLYYRLAVFPIHMPPLRAHIEDLPAIARSFLDDLSRRTGRGPWDIDEAQLHALCARDWPGNIRELVNVLERATILAEGRWLDFAPGGAPRSGRGGKAAETGGFPTLAEVERGHIVTALRRCDGKLYGKGGAAELLGLPGSTVASRMKKHGLGTARDFRG